MCYGAIQIVLFIIIVSIRHFLKRSPQQEQEQDESDMRSVPDLTWTGSAVNENTKSVYIMWFIKHFKTLLHGMTHIVQVCQQTSIK